MNSKEIRKEFLNYFKTKGHAIVPSAPVVVKDDPTLMFTNAGMNQFKDYFLGLQKAEDGIRDYYASRGLGDVYKRQAVYVSQVNLRALKYA